MDEVKKYFSETIRTQSKLIAAIQVTEFLSARAARKFASNVKEFAPRFAVRKNKNQGRTRKRYAVVRVIEERGLIKKLVRMKVLRIKPWKLQERI